MSRPDPAAQGLVAVLRPAPEGRETVAALKRLHFRAVAAPTMRIRYTGRAGVLHPREFPGLTLFTSPRGVAALIRRLTPAARSQLRRMKPAAAVVGPATAAAARAAGYRVIAGAHCNGAAELQRVLARLPPRRAPHKAAALHVVSPERSGPLPEFLHRLSARTRLSWRITRHADYEALADAPGLHRLQTLLHTGGLSALLVGSPRQMDFARHHLAPVAQAALYALPCVVPGDSTAQALRRMGFLRVAVAPGFQPQACRRALTRLLLTRA